MQARFNTTEYRRDSDLAGFSAEGLDVVVVSTSFEPLAESKVHAATGSGLGESSIELLKDAVRMLKFGGLLFVYGLPRELAFWGEHLSRLSGEQQRIVFKYWIALDIDQSRRNDLLKSTHLGLLMYVKAHASRNGTSPLHLNTDAVRIPHANCAACGKSLKDWGGKRHLMNPKGAALSDVWRDLPRRVIRDSIIPKDVLARIGKMTQVKGGQYLHVIQEKPRAERSADSHVREFSSLATIRADKAVRTPIIKPNHVLQTDCISFLNKVAAKDSEGLFDLAFADPPYNLQKLYGNYDDALAEHRYIDWCNQWLEGMARTLKPGGSLFVLNLPKWAIHHAAFLNQQLEFRHWIVWDALSDPRGKLMPAHYALLWYTKPGGKPIFNYLPADRLTQAAPRREAELQSTGVANADAVLPPDSPRYCLRAGCVNRRKRTGDDEKVELSDIWFDIHRIKHKRDRDAHPCQLPEKLLERIILLTTRRGGLVFDPFCGAGTTAIVASRLLRNFVVTDVDPHYVRITREKLAAMERNARMNGDLAVPRNTVKRPRPSVSKREIELCLQNLARDLGRVPTEADIQNRDASLLKKIDAVYETRGAALKRARVALAI